jgi:tRNA pseudouridine38-40 synthase
MAMDNRYKLTFEYDGTDFNGWQKQPEGRTVQGVIEEALSTLYQQEINIVGQGRTDSGVHAKAQVAHAELPDTYSISRLYRAMSGLLERDVALLKAEKVADDFHARFHAISRSYQYHVLVRRSPLKRHYSWFVFKPLVYERLSECAGMIQGEHDFINFCIPHDEPKMTTICHITKSRWKKKNGLLIYEIQGNRFLRHLVRRLVGAMIHVADGTREIKDFQHLLNSQEIKQKGHAAPAKGLTLVDVRY